MGVIIIQTTNVEYCNECPFCHTKEDRSCCFDSFDEPNYDFYCKSDKADNSHTEKSKSNNNFGKYISTTVHWSEKCDIPNWCPFKKEQTQKLPSFDDSQGTLEPHPSQEIALNG